MYTTFPTLCYDLRRRISHAISLISVITIALFIVTFHSFHSLLCLSIAYSGGGHIINHRRCVQSNDLSRLIILSESTGVWLKCWCVIECLTDATDVWEDVSLSETGSTRLGCCHCINYYTVPMLVRRDVTRPMTIQYTVATSSRVSANLELPRTLASNCCLDTSGHKCVIIELLKCAGLVKGGWLRVNNEIRSRHQLVCLLVVPMEKPIP